MGFVLGTVLVIAFLFAVLVIVGRMFPGTGAEVVDWEPTRSPEVEAQNEVDDIEQMIAAQNEMRRRRGAPELTEEELQRQVAEDERNRLRGRGPFSVE